LKIIIELLSTVFFIGYLPAGGTLATIASFPVVILMTKLSFVYQLVVVLIFVFFSIFLSSYAERIFGKKDDKKIVIDEFVGFLVACVGLEMISINKFFVTFLLFRIFDIFKFGINKLQKLPAGLGVTIDDFVAGVLTNIFIRILFS